MPQSSPDDRGLSQLLCTPDVFQPIIPCPLTPNESDNSFELGAHVRERLIAARQTASMHPGSLSAVSRESAADTVTRLIA